VNVVKYTTRIRDHFKRDSAVSTEFNSRKISAVLSAPSRFPGSINFNILD